MLGQLLGGRYQIIQVLGSGGFGHTYIAEDTQRPGNPRCVLKHLTFASQDPAVLQQVRRLFQVEAETLERLGQHDQIPRLLAYFEQDQEFYLVQELIQGQPLSQELTEGRRFPETAVIAVIEDVLRILEFVHAQGVIHRDIKPENLIRRYSDGKLVLIDFGAVKTINNTVATFIGETQMSLPVYTSGYAASEQCMGRPQFNSDLYALGMVGIQMLTGCRPVQLPHDLHTSEVIWRDQTPVSQGLASFLDQMIRFHALQRFQSAEAALDALHQLIAGSPTELTGTGRSTQLEPVQTKAMAENPRSRLTDRRHPKRGWHSWRKGPWLAGLGLGLATAAGVLLARDHLPLGLLTPSVVSPTIPPATTTSPSNGSSVDLLGRISQGEKLLNRWQPSPQKQEGIAQFAAGNYPQAIAALEAARLQNQADPELLIYLNNARIGNRQAYKIAVAVPLGDTFGSAMEILRGVAQVQDEINQAGGVNGVPLRVAIANDDNQPDMAQQIATALVGDPNLLGVIGHGISDTTLAAAQVYQKNGLVLVSPLSSAVQLANVGNYIFRTMPSDRLTAKALANHLLTQLKKQKVAVFFSSASAYSTSLKNEFKDALFYNGVEVLEEFDFSRPDFDAAASLEQALSKGAEAIMLAPGSETADRALLVIKLNGGQLPVLAGDSVATPKLLKVAGKDAVGIVVAVPANLDRSPFLAKASQLWGNQADISWRTALAYDASRALVAAIQRDPTRLGLQRALSQPGFSTTGSTGDIGFGASGELTNQRLRDRQTGVYLMTVAPITINGQTTYTYQSLPQ